MIFDVYLNNVPISSLSDKIIVRDIIEEPVEEEAYKTKRSIYPGQRLSRIVRRALSVSITFVIRERNPAKRAEILDKVAAWARDGGALQPNYRRSFFTVDGITFQQGKQLTHAVLTKPPVQDSANKWTQDLTMTFTAFDVPYWENINTNIWNFAATYDTVWGVYRYNTNFACMGTAPMSQMGLEVTNVSSSQMMSLDIVVGTWSSFHLENLYLEPGDRLVIDYDPDTGLLRIRDGNNSNYMPSRTAGSTDDLYLMPGLNDIGITSDVQFSGIITHRERYV